MASYYRRGLQWTKTSYLPAPSGGWNPDANWWELPDSQAPALDNFLLRPGKLVSRGPFIAVAGINIAINPGSRSLPVGYNFGDTAQPSLSPSGVMNLWWKVDGTVSGAYIDPWFAPLLNAPAANLAQGAVNAQDQISLDTGGVQEHSLASRDLIGGPRWTNFNGLLYGISYDATAAAVHDVNNTYNIPPLNLLTMPVLQTSSSQRTSGGGANGEWLASVGSDNAAVGSVAWVNPNNVTTQNHGTPATVTLNVGQQSHYVQATFGTHAVPAGANITGIQVILDAQTNGVGAITDASIKLLKGGTIQGFEHADGYNNTWESAWITGFPSNPAQVWRSYGGPNDLWGLSLTPADVNAANFGVGISVQSLAGTGAQLQIASIWVQVYYTVDNVSVPTALTNAPKGAFDLKGYLSRIWLLGGVDVAGGLTVHEPASLYYTNPLGTPGAGSPLGSASVDWKDPVTATSNKLQMDVNFEDFGVGLAQAPNALLVFRRNSVWRLTGTTSSSFVLRPISREVGCIDARSIVEVDKGVFWLSQRGLMFTDGTSIKNVSGAVQQDLTAAIAQAQGILQQSSTRTQGMAFATAQLTSKGTVMITVGYSVNSIFFTNWTGMYDPATGAYTRHTSRLWWDASPVFLVGRPGRQQLYSVGNTQVQNHLIVQLENYAYADSTTWGTSFLNPLYGSQNSLEDVDKTTLFNNSEYSRVTIPLVFVTKLLPFDVAHKSALTKRWFVDYAIANSTSSTYKLDVDAYSVILGALHLGASGSGPWVLTPVGTVGNPPTFSLGFHVQQLVVPVVARVSREYTHEIDDTYFVIQAEQLTNVDTDSTPRHRGINARGQGLAVVELYGVGIDYQQTRDDVETDGNF